MKLIIALVILWETILTANAQRFQYKYYTEKDGLGNNVVSCILMDNEGFLWAGTSFGLNRFDGNSFEKFNNDPSDSTSIADNTIQKIFLDRQYRLWIGTNAGISLYHPQTHSFSNYFPDTSVLPQTGISFQAVCDDDNGKIWVGAKNDLLVFDPASKKFSSSGWSRFASVTAPANGNHLRVIILGVIRKGSGELWVLSTYGLFSVKTETKEFRYYPYAGITDYHGSELNYADDRSNVWISTYSNGILSYNSQSGIWSNYHNLPHLDNPHSILRYSGDTLMYCSSNSVCIFDPWKESAFSRISDSTGDETFLSDFESNAVIRFGNLLWVATSKGLVKITPTNSFFDFTPLTAKEKVDRIFKLSKNGALLFTISTGNFSAYSKRKDKDVSPVIIPGGDILQSRYLYFAEANDSLCYIDNDEHFYKYDSKSNTTLSVVLPPKRNPGYDYDIRNMVLDRNGIIWVRTLSQGIMKYDIATNKLILADEIPLNGRKELNALYYDNLTNTLWIAEDFNGVYVYDIGTKKMQHFGLNKPPSQRNAAITNITGDGNGNIWLCDVQAGLIEYNHATNTFTRYTIYDGLPSNNCYFGVFDFKGMFWFNTDLGLCKYDPRMKKFTSYTEREGFPVLPGTFLSADRYGHLYMQFKNGYYSWTSAALKDPVKTGLVYLRDILLFNRHLPGDSAYHFSHAENNIRVLFGLLSFDDREKVTLEYSLNGGSWVSTDIHSYISFINLAPGNYDLSVRIKNESIPAIHLRFIIAQPFWLTWWFISLLVLIILTGILLIVRSRMTTIRKETSLQQKVMESEMSALRSQMNPHFIFNTLNSINSYIIENKRDEASDFLTDFSRLMRIILDHSQKQTVTLGEELNALKLYLELESRRLEASFDYNITINNEVDPSSVFIPPLIIQPFVENAIWHGLRGKKSEGHITIRVQKRNDGLLIEIEDDGVGRVSSGKTQKLKNSHSFGTDATRQRILLNDPKSTIEIEDLYHTDGKAAGTRVIIYLNHINI